MIRTPYLHYLEPTESPGSHSAGFARATISCPSKEITERLGIAVRARWHARTCELRDTRYVRVALTVRVFRTCWLPAACGIALHPSPALPSPFHQPAWKLCKCISFSRLSASERAERRWSRSNETLCATPSLSATLSNRDAFPSARVTRSLLVFT